MKQFSIPLNTTTTCACSNAGGGWCITWCANVVSDFEIVSSPGVQSGIFQVMCPAGTYVVGCHIWIFTDSNWNFDINSEFYPSADGRSCTCSECCWSSMHCDVCLEYISLRSLECYPVWIIPGGLFFVQFSAGLWDHHTFDLPRSSPFFVCFELDFMSVLQPGRHHMFRNMRSTILMKEFIFFKCLIVLFDNLLMHIRTMIIFRYSLLVFFFLVCLYACKCLLAFACLLVRLLDVSFFFIDVCYCIGMKCRDIHHRKYFKSKYKFLWGKAFKI